MTVNSDLSTALGRVKAAIGDSDSSLISDSVISYILTDNDDNENVTILKCLEYIVADLTKKVDQRVDEVDVKWSKLLDQYRKLLNSYKNDPSYQLTKVVPLIRGGCNKPDLAVGDFSKTPTPDLISPYYYRNK